jgi:endonuclease/exonuclease/phosphatase (EEP) superfamily protein YafD
MLGPFEPRSLASRLITSGFVLLCVASLLALFAPLGWPFELFAHFRAQYAAAAAAGALILLWQRQPGYAAAALLLAAWHGIPVGQRALAGSAPDCRGPALTVASLNVRYVNTRTGLALDWLGHHDVDLVVIQEVTGPWAAALDEVPGFPHRAFFPRPDPYGIGVLSRRPLHALELIDLAGDGLPSLSGVVDVEGRPVRFLGLHTRWPVLPDLARARDQALEEVARIVTDESRPTVVLGDLNLTPDSPAFGRLLEDGGLRDAVVGPGWRPTWRAGFWPLALRIDHVLVSDGLCAVEAKVGESVGSDHRPILARLQLTTAADLAPQAAIARDPPAAR